MEDTNFSISDTYPKQALSHVPSPNQHLTFTQLKRYYDERRFDVTRETFLNDLGFYTPHHRFNYTAYLMADVNGNSMKVARFRGTNKIDILERNEFGHCCLIRSTNQILDKLQTVNYTLEKKGLYLVDQNTLKKAVLHATIYNDYIQGAYPVVEVYDDRLEVVFSGSLPNGYSKTEYLQGTAPLPNKELVTIFTDVGLMMPNLLKTFSRAAITLSENFISLRFDYKKEV